MAITLKDISRQAGVHVATVSKVLNNTYRNARITDECARKVQKVAAQLGYLPHAGARAMVQRHFGCIALLLSRERTWSILPDQLLSGIQHSLNELGLNLLISSLPDDKLTSDEYVPRILREASSDGLLINYNANIPQRMLDLIHAHHLPAVWINSKQEHNTVYPDDFKAAYDTANHLLSLGHRHIVWVDFNSPTDDSPCHYSQRDRQAGYAKAMSQAGLTPQRIGDRHLLGHFQTVAAVAAALTVPDPPTAMLCYDTESARSAYMAARLTGLEVPRQLSMAVFCDRRVETMDMKFATVCLPEFQLGQAAVALLLRRIANPEPDQPAQSMPFDFRPGQSIAPPL